MGLSSGKEAIFLFKASSVVIGKENSMKLSAANQLKGKVSAIVKGAVNDEITIDVDGIKISSIITEESSKSMSLKLGDEVVAIIKATQIIVGIK